MKCAQRGLVGGRGAPGALPGVGSEAHPEKKTRQGTPEGWGLRGRIQARGHSRQLPDARRSAPGAAGQSPAHLGGPGAAGAPPHSASSFSPPLRRLLPTLPARLPGMVEGVGSTRQGGPGRGGRLAPARPRRGARSAGGSAVSGSRSLRRRRNCR